MAKTKFSSRIAVLAGVMIAALVAAFVAPVFRVGVSATEHSEYYNDNKPVVEIIDEDARYFSQLDALGDNEKMQEIVKAAKAVKEFEDGYDENDYVPADWKAVSKWFKLCENSCKVSGDEDDGPNYYLTYDADKNISYISSFKNKVDEIPSKQKQFDDLVEKDKRYFDDKVRSFLVTTDNNPDLPVNQKWGMYDEKGVEDLRKVAKEAKLALDAMTLDKNKFEDSLADVDEKKEEYANKLFAVERNDLERACSAINDYYSAVSDGAGEDDIADKKAAADALVDSAYGFLRTADPSVAKYYATQKGVLDRYTATPKEHDFSDLEDKSFVASEDGVVTVTAFVDGVETAVIPHDVTVRIADNSASIYKLNAENAIVGKYRDISVAYCLDVALCQGTGRWNAAKKADGKDVVYRVAVDLERFFEVCVKNNKSWLDEKLGKLGINKDERENYTAGVIDCAAYLSENDTGASLCYHYLGRGKVEGLVASVENGTIIFETKSFSNFAVVKAGGRSVLTSPVFWLIFILAIVLAFVAFVIVMACIRYTIRFYTNGGTEVAPVKAKKDEYFVMPKAPTKRGYVFGGWFEDPEFNVRFVDTFMVKRRSFKVYAKWNVALSAEQADNYYLRLREMLASHAAIGDGYALEKGAKIRLAKLVNEGMSDKLYLALKPDGVLKTGSFNVKAVGAECPDTPLLKVIESPDDYQEAVALVNLLVAQYTLKDTAIVIEDGASKTYVLEICDSECEVTAPAAAVEPVAESAPVEEKASEEELLDYYKEIRKFAKGFALAEDNADIDKDATILRVFLKEDCVEVYLKGDPAELGVQNAEGALAAETPALIKICCDETLTAAKAAVKTVMEGMGLEETGLEVDLGDSDARSFGYKLKYID